MDPRARLTHLFDQSDAALQDMARPLARYYRRLIEEGLPPEHALRLVRDVQARYLGTPRSDDGD